MKHRNFYQSTDIKNIFATLFLVLALTTSANAADEKLECDLYVQSSMGDDTGSSIDVENAGTLMSERLSGLCLFADGTTADKQFVNISLASPDGSTGSNSGISIYTMENGDSLHLRYIGEWGSKGFVGQYEVSGGSGKYEGAKGDGIFTGAQSPWKNQGKFNVVLNIATQ